MATTTTYRHEHDGMLYRVTSTPGRRSTDPPTLTMERRRDVASGPAFPLTDWGPPVPIDGPQLRGLLAFSFTKVPELAP